MKGKQEALKAELVSALLLVCNSDGHWHLCTGHGPAPYYEVNARICDKIRAALAKAKGE